MVEELIVAMGFLGEKRDSNQIAQAIALIKATNLQHHQRPINHSSNPDCVKIPILAVDGASSFAESANRVCGGFDDFAEHAVALLIHFTVVV